MYYNTDLDAILDDQGNIALSEVSENISPTECDAAVDLMNFHGRALTFDELYPLLIEDERSLLLAETACLIASPSRFSTFRIIRNAECEIRIIFGNAPVPTGSRVLVRWEVDQTNRWVDYDE